MKWSKCCAAVVVFVMYFSTGWPKTFTSKGVQCGELTALKYNRDRSLIAVVSSHSVLIWCNKPRVLIFSYRRSVESVRENGSSIAVAWKTDSSALVVTTSEGMLIFYEVQRNNGVYLYTPRQVNSSGYHQSATSPRNGVPSLKLTEAAFVTVSGGIVSVAARSEELFVCSGGGLLHRVSWEGELEQEPLPVHSILFTSDLENGRALPLDHDGVCFRAMQYSPLLGGFAVVLADGRGGFLSASTASFESSDIIGLWAHDLHSATCTAVNHRYRLIAFGCTNGECLVYGFDDITGALQITHKLVLSSKDYPDAIQKTGSVQCLAWTPDGCAIAVAWSWASHGGLAVWSVFGSLLLCTLGGDYGTSQESFLHNPLHVISMGWGPEGYNLVMVSTEEENGATEDITQLQFVKSTLTVNPCMSNHEHLFLQGEESLYLNTGDMVSETSQTLKSYSGVSEGLDLASFGGSPVGHSTLVSNKQWQIIQIPQNYLESNWPVRYAAIDSSGSFIAVAGRTGMAHYSLATRKWKLFGNVSQEQCISCRGGLAWWKDFLIFPCYNVNSSSDQISFYPRSCNLDNAFSHSVKLPAPAFLVNVFRNLLLVYCADSRVIFFSLRRAEGNANPTVEVSRMQEFSLASYIPHPLAVVHITLTSAYLGSKPLQGLDGVESLIANVAGWLLMFQKDKATPEKERKTRKASFAPPVALASCVENVWTSSSSNLTKRHLMEALWLGCGAQGMKVWLPLFPGNDEKPPNFLSKRIMLPFQLKIYPLAILFQDAVVLGAATEPMALEVTSPVLSVSLSPQPFPFCTLERTTQVYLHHILRQLLKRNLGQQALLIANTCTDLPYFAHVLELLLHDVLEEEATASGPIPDALLPRIVAFIQEFPQYLQTVVHCARKTEVALWGYLFSAVGNPRDLFKECLSSGQLQTAASYLIILQNLEHPSVSKQHAAILLDAALEHCQYEIAKDLVRFLRCISVGELESPPRSPTGFKPTHSPPHSAKVKMENEDLSITMPYIVNPHARSTTMSKSGQRGSLNRGGSLEKPHTHLARTTSLEKAPGSKCSVNERRGRSISSLPPTPTSAVEARKFMEMETPGHFFIETILNRHARLLLSTNRLKELGKFAAHLDFNLVAWFTKERNRAAVIDNYVDSLATMHKQFEWPYPTVAQQKPKSNLPTSPKPREMTARKDRLSSISSNSSTVHHRVKEIEVTMGTTLAEISDENASELGIEVEEVACLAPVQENESGLVSAEPSETSSVSYSMEGDDDSVWWVDGAAYLDMEAVRAQLAVTGSKQAQLELGYLLQVMTEASCYEWWLLLGLLLRDSDSVTECIERAVQNRDSSLATIMRLKDGLAALEKWAEQNCLGYGVFFGLHKIHWQILDETIANAKIVTSVQKESGSAQECERRSRQTSVSKDEESAVRTPEETGFEKANETEKEEEYECIIS